MRYLLCFFVLSLVGCIPSPQSLKKPVTIIGVEAMPKTCRATLMGKDGEIYSLESNGACNWQIGQLLDTQ